MPVAILQGALPSAKTQNPSALPSSRPATPDPAPLTFLSLSSWTSAAAPRSLAARSLSASRRLAAHGSRTTAAAPHPVNTAPEVLSLLREFGFDAEEAEALLRRHRPLALSCPDSLRRRLASLRSTGIGGSGLLLVAAKQPEILTSEGIDRFLSFVGDEIGGIDPPKLERLLTTADPQSLGGVPNRIKLLVDHGVPREKLRHVVNGVNIKKVFCGMSSEELEQKLLLLRRVGDGDGDGSYLIIRRPLLLNLDLHLQLVPRIAYITQLAGGDDAAAGKLIRKLPAILTYTVEHIQSHMEFWRSVGLGREQVFRVALVYPSIFSASKERKLTPRVEFLKQCHLDADGIFRFLVKAPLFLSLSDENLRKKLAFLVKIGYLPRTRDVAVGMGAVTRTSCENLQAVVGLLLSYGFCADDVLAMCRRHPQLLHYNSESLEEKLEYLVGEMGREVGELLAFPAFLGYKLDDRIKQRYEVKKKVRGRGLSLNKLLSVSTERFYSGKQQDLDRVTEN